MTSAVNITEMGRVTPRSVLANSSYTNPPPQLAFAPGNYVTFVRAIRYTIPHLFYSKDIFRRPLQSSSEYSGAGQTSYTILQDLTVLDSKETLMTIDSWLVTVDPISRQPIELPENLRHFIQSKSGHEKVIPKITIPTVPPQGHDVYRTHHRVVWSDLDSNRHVNQGKYCQIALDAIAEAAATGYFQMLPRDIDEARITLMEMQYELEAVLKDMFDVTLWEANPWEVIVYVVKSNNQPVFKFRVKYLPLGAKL